jgi:hypothetical protein
MNTRTRMTTSVLALAALACGDAGDSPTAPASPDPQSAAAAASVGSWVARADYPRDIWRATSTAVTDPSTQRTIVYVIGGEFRSGGGGSGSMTDAVKAYDVHADVWRSKARYPVRVHSTNGAVAIDGKVYVSGGFTRRWDERRGVWRLEVLRSLYVYDPATDTWSRRRDMPFATAGGSSAAYKGKFYVATLCDHDTICDTNTTEGALWRYNPSTDQWVLITRTPHDPWKAGAGFIGGRLYIGGWQGAMDIYDPATNTWSAGEGMPAGTCGAVAATLQAKLYFVGCFAPNIYNAVTLVFDPKVGWSEAAVPPVPAGSWMTLSRVIVSGQPRLELIGGPMPGTNWQFKP